MHGVAGHISRVEISVAVHQYEKGKNLQALWTSYSLLSLKIMHTENQTTVIYLKPQNPQL